MTDQATTPLKLLWQRQLLRDAIKSLLLVIPDDIKEVCDGNIIEAYEALGATTPSLEDEYTLKCPTDQYNQYKG